MAQFPHPDDQPDVSVSPLEAILGDWEDPEVEEEEFRNDFFRGLDGRRKKAALVLAVIWTIVITLHYWHWGSWVVWGLTIALSLQALRLMVAQPEAMPEPLAADMDEAEYQTVSLLVAAKNEEAVIEQLVRQLCTLDYPGDRYDVWVVDDHSTDNTPVILEGLAQEYSQLKVIRRQAGAGGGKSGALNEVLRQAPGQIIGVFDADAQVTNDLLRRVVPYFQQPQLGALQVRKAIANDKTNFWTRGQATEMVLDACFQQQRIATGGIGELRGNGQFVARKALDQVGGWNEQTITDDLDLTIRLHLGHWQVGILPEPAVEEEGVTSALALWHQRNRWAEGGYQRYLDYWRWLVARPLGWRKRLDLFSFLLMQYLLPTAAVPDLLISLWRQELPLLAPLSSLAIVFSSWGMYTGLNRFGVDQDLAPVPRLLWCVAQTLQGTLYMFHWLVVMPCVTMRMAFRQKRLKWVKTVHGLTSGVPLS